MPNYFLEIGKLTLRIKKGGTILSQWGHIFRGRVDVADDFLIFFFSLSWTVDFYSWCNWKISALSVSEGDGDILGNIIHWTKVER